METARRQKGIRLKGEHHNPQIEWLFADGITSLAMLVPVGEFRHRDEGSDT